MLKKKVAAIAIKGFALLAVLGTGQHAVARDATTPYPKMAPIEQYLMDRDAEIALARSAAPDAISHDASVIVLTRHGYETAVEGKNGWVCWVGRGWMAMFDHPEFWNPKVRAADCLNPPAARTVLPYAYKRTELLLAGHSKQEVIAAIKAAIDKKELPALEQGTVSYMMSKSSYLTDNGDHDVPHLMFFQTDKPDAAWGECSGCVCELLVLVCGGVSTAQELSSHGCLLGDGAQMVRWDPRPTHVAPTE
jgi:hypothetical protein